MQTYTVIDFFTDNPILFIGLIAIAIFWIALAIFFTVNYLKYKKAQKNRAVNSKLRGRLY